MKKEWLIFLAINYSIIDSFDFKVNIPRCMVITKDIKKSIDKGELACEVFIQ